MKERIYMNQEMINVSLTTIEDMDVLLFDIDGNGQPIRVNLNSTEGQQDLKGVFSALLKRLYSSDIKLQLRIEPTYRKGLYIEVCQEYVNDLNKELKDVREEIIRL